MLYRYNIRLISENKIKKILSLDKKSYLLYILFFLKNKKTIKTGKEDKKKGIEKKGSI